MLQSHWRSLAEWQVTTWQPGSGVFHGDEPTGLVNLRARDFPTDREVKTSAWLGLKHQRRGYGTEARFGLLTLAFDHLGANAALTEVFQGNHASHGVSRNSATRMTASPSTPAAAKPSYPIAYG
ncbi:GNAT family N-acetyltransferase [Micromonospora sp. NBC_00362]|nr:GNAT family N-acetyltransferase [Micromonospora sp. NBC_00362]